MTPDLHALRLCLISSLFALGGCQANGPAKPGDRSDLKPTTSAYVQPSPETTELAASQRSKAIGKPAPPFTLKDQSETPRSLSQYRGRWLVLYFYPQDDTPGCACQANEFTALLGDFSQAKADIVGISPDMPSVHEFFARKYTLNFPLLSDEAKVTMRQYGAWVDIPEGLAAPGRVIRSTYLIDPKGNIAWHWPEVIPQGHAQRVIDRLKTLQSANQTTRQL